MQLPAHFLALLAAVTLISVDARPVKRATRMITLPIRQVQRDMHVHVELVSTDRRLSISPHPRILAPPTPN